MAYNLKTDEASYHAKLTAIGRQLLAQGTLTFRSFAVGDSEIDYLAASAAGSDLTSLRVLRPVDSQPDLKYPVLPAAGLTALAPLSGTSGQTIPVQNQAPSRGPFRFQTDPKQEFQLDITRPANGATTFVREVLAVRPGASPAIVQAQTVPANTQAGDWLWVHWLNPAWTPAVAATSVATTRYAFDPANPGVYLLYQIQAISGANLTLDRPVPFFTGGPFSPAFVFPGGDSIENVYGPSNPVLDWNEDQLAFMPTPPIAAAQVGLWNCTIVYGEAVMGLPSHPLAGFPSQAFAGTRRYLGYPGTGSPLAVLHYSNHVVHNLYGEALIPATVEVNLPGVNWWNSPTATGGLLLTTSPNRQQTTGGNSAFTLIFHTLLDTQGRGVGRVYPALKMVVLDDPELVTAISAKSNRNWTLPPFDYFVAGGATTPTDLGGLLDLSEPTTATTSNRTLHVTYALTNTNDGTWSAAKGYGLRSGLPCQYVSRSAVTLASVQYVEFKLQVAQLRHLSDGATGNGTGYSAQGMQLLFQETSVGQRPRADNWVVVDLTSRLTPAPTSVGAALTRDAVAGLYRVSGADLRAAQAAALSGGTFYRFPDGGTPDALTCGEEVVLLGNLHASIGATVFRTSFLLSLGEGQYATSTNPTWQAGQPVALTELGIYDQNSNLVATGKLVDPLLKSAGQSLFLDVSLDF